jgi:hypothetical protein
MIRRLRPGRAALALAGLLLVGACAHVAQAPNAVTVWRKIEPPPPEFSGPFLGKLYIEDQLDAAELSERCGLPVVGCAWVPASHGLRADECTILIAKRYDLDRQAIGSRAELRPGRPQGSRHPRDRALPRVEAPDHAVTPLERSMTSLRIARIRS